jgi:hypothetical protein
MHTLQHGTRQTIARACSSKRTDLARYASQTTTPTPPPAEHDAVPTPADSTAPARAFLDSLTPSPSSASSSSVTPAPTEPPGASLAERMLASRTAKNGAVPSFKDTLSALQRTQQQPLVHAMRRTGALIQSSYAASKSANASAKRVVGALGAPVARKGAARDGARAGAKADAEAGGKAENAAVDGGVIGLSSYAIKRARRRTDLEQLLAETLGPARAAEEVAALNRAQVLERLKEKRAEKKRLEGERTREEATRAMIRPRAAPAEAKVGGRAGAWGERKVGKRRLEEGESAPGRDWKAEEWKDDWGADCKCPLSSFSDV